MSQRSLSIVMPVYNEEEIIEEVVRAICNQILSSFEKPEFIIINDGSNDLTPSILQKLSKEYPYLNIITNHSNLGHGASLMKGYSKVNGEYVFYLDSDNQIPVEEFWLLWEKIQKENLDIVTGIRKERKDPIYRLLISKILQLFNRIIFGVKIRDINCPFKLYKSEALQRILTTIPKNTKIPSILMLLAANQLQLKIGEMEVIHSSRKTGRSFIRDWKILKLCWQALKELIKFKIKL